MNTQDLGTYYLKVLFHNAKGYYYQINTGSKLIVCGSDGDYSLDSTFRDPPYKDEEDLISNVVWYFTEGNQGCDCNHGWSIARAEGREDPDLPCGETLKISQLILVCPNREEKIIYETLDISD